MSTAESTRDGATGGRKWLGVHFRCCNTYGRLYRDAAGSQYTGRCPRCAVEVQVPIGEGGTDRRFFEAR